MNCYTSHCTTITPKRNGYPFPPQFSMLHHRLRPVLLLLLFFIVTTPAFAEPVDPPWHIMADTFSYDDESGIYSAEGNVVVTRDNSQLTSDFLEYDSREMNAFARGHVIVTSKGDTSTADKVLMDLKNDTGTLYGGTVFIKANNLYIKGDKIKKIGEASYTADKVSITTCDGDSPDWKITGRDLDVTIEGYGSIYHAAFWAKKVPMLYSPYFFFPVKIERQSGLLPPEISISNRKGFDYLQPYFWAISDNTDATLYNRYMDKRGNMVGAEYRYVLSPESKGTLMYDFLDDKKIDDGTEDATRLWGYDDDSIDDDQDTTPRENSKRYWFRMKKNQSLPDDFTMKLDVDVVSDQDYLREFDDKKNGYEKSKSYYTENFGRDLEAEDDTIRTNSLILNKSWTSYSLNASAYWYDNVINRRYDRTDTTLQRLPQIDFTGSRQQLLNTPFYFNLDSEYDYFFRQDTTASALTGHRADIYPRIYLPYRFKSFFSLEPSMGLRETLWYIDDDSLFSDEDTGTHERTMYDLNVDLSTDVYKVFNTNWKIAEKVKHSLTPKLVYNYVPERDQSEYPIFDAIDRIGENNDLTFSLTNYLTSRFLKNNVVSERTDSYKSPEYVYRQFCRFKLEQTYDINEANRSDGEKKEPFSDLYGELEFSPINHLNLEADGKWSNYGEGLTEGNVAIWLSDKRGDKLKVEQRYTRYTTSPEDGIKSIKSNLFIKITNRFSLYAENERDLNKGEDIKTMCGIIYNAQCWGIDFNYSNEPDDKQLSFTFNLSGIGDFGSSSGIPWE